MCTLITVIYNKGTNNFSGAHPPFLLIRSGCFSTQQFYFPFTTFCQQQYVHHKMKAHKSARQQQHTHTERKKKEGNPPRRRQRDEIDELF